MNLTPLWSRAFGPIVLQIIPVPSAGIGGFIGSFDLRTEHAGIQLQVGTYLACAYYCSHAKSHEARK